MAGSQVYDLKPIPFLAVREDGEAVVAPNLVLDSLFRVLNLRLEIRPIALLELAAERPLCDLPRDPPPSEHQLHFVMQLSARLLQAPHKCTGIEARRRAPLSGPLGQLAAKRLSARPFRFGIGQHEREPRCVWDFRPVTGKGQHGNARSATELLLHKPAHHGLDLGLLVQRRAPVTHDLLHCWLVPDSESIRPHLSNEVGPTLECERRIVDCRSVQLRLAEGEAQLWEVRDFICLTSRRLEEDRGPNTPVDIA